MSTQLHIIPHRIHMERGVLDKSLTNDFKNEYSFNWMTMITAFTHFEKFTYNFEINILLIINDCNGCHSIWKSSHMILK